MTIAAAGPAPASAPPYTLMTFDYEAFIEARPALKAAWQHAYEAVLAKMSVASKEIGEDFTIAVSAITHYNLGFTEAAILLQYLETWRHRATMAAVDANSSIIAHQDAVDDLLRSVSAYRGGYEWCMGALMSMRNGVETHDIDAVGATETFRRA